MGVAQCLSRLSLAPKSRTGLSISRSVYQASLLQDKRRSWTTMPTRTTYYSSIKQIPQPPPPPKVAPDFVKQNFARFKLPPVKSPSGEIPYEVDRAAPEGVTPLPIPPYVTNPFILMQLKKMYSLNHIQPPQWGLYPVWHAKARRSGVIARKVGQTHTWNEHGVRVPLTVLQIDRCQVVKIRTYSNSDKITLTLGAGHCEMDPEEVHPKHVDNCRRAGVELKEYFQSFEVTPDAVLPVGTEITAGHFMPGEYVDIQGRGKDKGFQGVMKRHHFKGKSQTHGVSVSHRLGGSIGNRKTPGRVWKGMKMAGHMGDRLRTIKCIQVYKVDLELNLIYVRGAVPGNRDHYVNVRDALFRPSRLPLPFPTYFPAEGDPREIICKDKDTTDLTKIPALGPTAI